MIGSLPILSSAERYYSLEYDTKMLVSERTILVMMNIGLPFINFYTYFCHSLLISRRFSSSFSLFLKAETIWWSKCSKWLGYGTNSNELWSIFISLGASSATSSPAPFPFLFAVIYALISTIFSNIMKITFSLQISSIGITLSIKLFMNVPLSVLLRITWQFKNFPWLRALRMLIFLPSLINNF